MITRKMKREHEKEKNYFFEILKIHFGDIPSSGYYYMMAACEGGDDKRCEGGGTLKKR